MAESVPTLPVIDLDLFRSQPLESTAVIAECRKAADALITYGALLLHDERVSEDDNSTFLDLLEDYFDQPLSDLKMDEHPEVGYQVGVTLENTEKPKCAVDEPCLRVIARLEPSERPLDITAHDPDPKCRFFWRMGERPTYESQFPGLNAPNVVPQADSLKARWDYTMNKWGTSMKNAVEGLAEMAAVGLGLSRETFTDAGRYGPHLLAPTASDLVKYGQKDTILAGFHTDLNFLTIHGRSRYPGLHIWARNTGKRIPVKFPPTGRYLLVQAGKQLEHLSGGLVKAGYHEVVVNEATVEVIERRKKEFPDRPLIRISSTYFSHLSSDYDLAPITSLASRARELRVATHNLGSSTDDSEETIYPPMKVGEQVQNELRHIALMA
ncbi:Clavaminate synthase-like protein [Artomyces pyxidatus]|uniref:Clavaminate synthase-like protein n=1 Tax=Artomyces pyxidatus TaxID=48021 RepID=A0ACB8TI97_9AGAM|nr:Clavaminate synthase-like protein [Artomyces pyxidatus]